MRLGLAWVPTSCPSPLPERTGQTSCQPALGCAPAARDSNPCQRPGERWRTQSAADRVCPLGRKVSCWPGGMPRQRRRSGLGDTHGSGECMGEDAWRMYCVHWKTRKARLARKSRADSKPATGRSWKPVLSETAQTISTGAVLVPRVPRTHSKNVSAGN